MNKHFQTIFIALICAFNVVAANSLSVTYNTDTKIASPSNLVFAAPLTATVPTTGNSLVNLTALNAAMSSTARQASTVAAMQALTGLSNGDLISTLGRTSVGDGGAATYYYLSGATTDTNRGTVFAATGMGSGRFFWDNQGVANIVMFGAIDYDGIDDIPAIQDAVNVLTGSSFGSGQKSSLVIPEGQWQINSSLLLTNPINLYGTGIEKNSVNVFDYPLNGSVLVSGITNGDPVIKLVGTDSGGRTYISGIELHDFGIDGNGSGTDGHGIHIDATANVSDMLFSRIIIRKVGGSAFRSGDGTKTGSPSILYSKFTDLTAIAPYVDGFEFYNNTQGSVHLDFSRLYVNDAGRNSFNFVGLGYFYANLLTENNAGQRQAGSGLRLQNVIGATFTSCFFEGDGRTDDSGYSLAPLYSAYALDSQGSSQNQFIGCTFTSPAGNLATPLTSGAVNLTISTAANGYSYRDSGMNTFTGCTIFGYLGTRAPTAAAVGSGGSLSAGVYRYRVTMVYSGGWESPLSASGETVVTAVASDRVNLSAISVGATLVTNTVTSRKIYRTAANGTQFKLLTTIADAVTTTYADTTADASLGAAASYFQLIYQDSFAYDNKFDACVFGASPLVSDNGINNSFDRLFILDTAPSLNPYPGKGSFNSALSSAANGTRHYFGSDNSGFLAGYGLTANSPHEFSFLLPSFDSYRQNQSQITIVRATTDATNNTVSIGGGGSGDYAATQVSVYAAANKSTAIGTEGLRVTSGGVRSLTPLTSDTTLGVAGITTLTNNLIVGGTGVFSNTVNIAGITRHAADVVLPSGGSLRGTNSVSGLAEIMINQSGSVVSVGPNSGTGRLELTPGSGGILVGSAGSSGGVFIKRPAFATSGATLKDSREVDTEAAYWNGAASTTVDVTTRVSMDSTAPAYSYRWKFGSTDLFYMKSDGSFTIPVATGTAPLNITSTTKVSNLNVDLLDGLDSTAFQPINATLTAVAAGTAQTLASTIISVTENTQVGTTYTVQSTDNGKVVTLNNASAITVTVPTLSAGFSCTFIQKGAGQVTFSASGTTINNAHSQTKTYGQYSAVTLYGLSSTSFVLAGDTGS